MVFEKAYAKVNFFLDIESRRSNGYHNIVSVMQTVDWFDEIRLFKNVSSGIEVSADSADIPVGGENIAYRAAQKYLDAISDRSGVTIEINKKIPIAAGMAGGSADAAAVLRGMNRLFGNKLSQNELLTLASTIGADVPFCLVGGTCLVEGIGERLTGCDHLFPDCPILCAKLGDGVSTPEAYQLLDDKYQNFENYTVHKKELECLFGGMKDKSAEKASLGCYNIFEKTVESMRPKVSLVKKTMLENGAFFSMMSGSGPSVFGLFHNVSDAERALNSLQKKGAEVKICYPISKFE